MNRKVYIWKINGRTYTDQELVEAILHNDQMVIEEFFFKICKPLFSAALYNFYTDCESVDELINEIFLYLLYEKEDERTKYHENSKLAKFEYRCTITGWMRLVVRNYCCQAFKKKANFDRTFWDTGDHNDCDDLITDFDLHSMNLADIYYAMNKMSNDRYRQLIKLRYLDDLSNEETAQRLELTMSNYYNKHKLAKEQFYNVLKMEGLL